MSDLHIVGVDLAKRVFQVHGADSEGRALFRRKLSRAQFRKFIASLDPVILAMEACASAHYWGRVAQAAGLEVRLVPIQYVKPFVKRHKNDMIDAEAIAEAAVRPRARFVTIKSEGQQSEAMLFRTRELFVRQRTQLINALSAHLSEFGIVMPQSRGNAQRAIAACEDAIKAVGADIEPLVQRYADQISHLDHEIAALEKTLKQRALTNDDAKRLQTMPGVGPISAMAIQAFCPAAETFRNGRDFASWLGLVPRQYSSGGKDRLGRITKMGQRDVRRLLIVGAMAVINASVRKGHCNDPWLARMLEKRPRLVVAVALANRMARRLWAMMAKKETYEVRVTA